MIMNEIAKNESFDLSPKSLAEAMELANILAASSIVPKDFQNNAGNILVAIQWGMELGLKPMQAMQNIAVINGRPCIWGDALLAIVQSYSACEYVKETFDSESMTAFCEVKRKSDPEAHTTSFSINDANVAGLTTKPGPWQQYPKRMLQMRARAYALRDKFSDALKGIPIAEEVQDYQSEKEINTPPTSKMLRERLAIKKDASSDLVAPDNETPNLELLKNKIFDCDTQEELSRFANDMPSFNLSGAELEDLRKAYKKQLAVIQQCNKEAADLTSNLSQK